ncbi:MAG: low temperature requirement protein A [Thermomicrobiales bacterium]
MWWIHFFDRTIELARARMGTAADPGRLGVLAYTFYHMWATVAGIIVAAAGDELSLAHPDETAGRATVLVLGDLRFFLLGNLLYKATMFGRISRAQAGHRLADRLMLVVQGRTRPDVAFAAVVVLLAVAVSDLSSELRRSAVRAE